MTATTPPVPLCIIHADAWREWLLSNGETNDGIWLLLAKKGTVTPTSLSYQEALEEALCSGWIDGQRKSLDAATFMVRFTPRRARSIWSLRNVGIVARLREDGRMREGGEREIARAKADGRWERAYGGPATAVAPPELLAALAAVPAAEAAFATLNSTERYSALHPVITAVSAETRDRRIARLVERLGTPTA